MLIVKLFYTLRSVRIVQGFDMLSYKWLRIACNYQPGMQELVQRVLRGGLKCGEQHA